MNLFFQGTTAVVGATNKKDRFGYKVFMAVKQRNPTLSVIPIHPTIAEIEGIPCKPLIDTISESIDTVVLIVNPTIGLPIVKKAYQLGVRKFWFQPGAESGEIREFCEEHDVLYSMGMCLLH